MILTHGLFFPWLQLSNAVLVSIAMGLWGYFVNRSFHCRVNFHLQVVWIVLNPAVEWTGCSFVSFFV